MLAQHLDIPRGDLGPFKSRARNTGDVIRLRNRRLLRLYFMFGHEGYLSRTVLIDRLRYDSRCILRQIVDQKRSTAGVINVEHRNHRPYMQSFKAQRMPPKRDHDKGCPSGVTSMTGIPMRTFRQQVAAHGHRGSKGPASRGWFDVQRHIHVGVMWVARGATGVGS